MLWVGGVSAVGGWCECCGWVVGVLWVGGGRQYEVIVPTFM